VITIVLAATPRPATNTQQRGSGAAPDPSTHIHRLGACVRHARISSSAWRQAGDLARSRAISVRSPSRCTRGGGTGHVSRGSHARSGQRAPTLTSFGRAPAPLTAVGVRAAARALFTARAVHSGSRRVHGSRCSQQPPCSQLVVRGHLLVGVGRGRVRGVGVGGVGCGDARVGLGRVGRRLGLRLGLGLLDEPAHLPKVVGGVGGSSRVKPRAKSSQEPSPAKSRVKSSQVRGAPRPRSGRVWR
jgi:hypothetical protein